MNILLCLDDNNGMLFNNRRQSRDSEVINRIYEISKGKHLLIHSFSRSLFEGNCTIDDNLLNTATEDDFCFVENLMLSPHINSINYLYIFRWNRSYPYDMITDVDFNSFTLINTEEFTGSSHDKITLEVYKS